jgi:hypothetical protein
MKNLFLFTLLIVTLLQCACSKSQERENIEPIERENIEALRLDNIKFFEKCYSNIDINNKECLMLREKYNDVLEKLKSFNLDDFKEPIIASAVLCEQAEPENYSLMIERIDPFFRAYDTELDNGKKTLVIARDSISRREKNRLSLKDYHKSKLKGGLLGLKMVYSTMYRIKKEDIKEENKHKLKVRFSKKGVPATEWYPVTFYDFESKEYQGALEKFKESVSKSQE